MRPAVVRIGFAKVNYINYNITVYRNFDIIAFLDIKSIVIILNITLAGKKNKLSTVFYKMFLYFFLAPIKREGKYLKFIDWFCTLKGSDSECRRNFIKRFPVKI